MNKLICVLLILVLICAVLTGCGSKEKSTIKSDEEAKQAVNDINNDLTDIGSTLDEVSEDMSGEEKP